MRPVVVYGGINTGYTIREVLKGCNVLCGTPGRLLDIIGRGKVMFPPPNELKYFINDRIYIIWLVLLFSVRLA